jgi:opacity protein-like surface antigen
MLMRAGELGRRVGLAICLLLLLPVLVLHEVRAQEAASDGWAFRAAPYFWATSLEGDVATIRGIPPADVDASFSDIWDNLNFAAMGYAEARHGRFGVGADLIYFDLSADGDGPTPLFSKAELDLTAFVGTVTGFYRFAQEEAITADAMAGARVWATDTELTLKPGIAAGRSTDDQEVWVDPIIGLRGFIGVTDKVGLRAYGDIGGFGLASDITYQVLGSVNYAFTDSITADAGYRYLKVDYDDGDYLLDVAFHGPFLGVVFEF